MFDIIQSIKAFRAARQEEQISPYRALVIMLADGGEPSPERIDSTIEQAGKSPEQLVEAVQLLIDRRGWAEQVRAAKEAERTMQEADASIAKLVAERDAIVASLSRKIDRLVESKRAAESLIHQSHVAASKLAETADHSIVEAEEQIAERLRELIPAQKELTYEAKRLAATIPSLKKTIDTRSAAFRNCYLGPDQEYEMRQIRRYQAEMEGNRLKLKRTENELAEVSEEIERLQRQIVATSEKRLLP